MRVHGHQSITTGLVLLAEVVCALGPGLASYQRASDQRPSADALQLVSRLNVAIKTVCGAQCPALAVFRNSTAPNAMLVNDSGQGRLVYSPQFFAAAYDRFGDAGILAIVAHETGHALDATMGAAWIKTSWPPEVRADAWAGCVLARLNPPLTNFQSSVDALAKYPSPSHPAWIERLPAIRAGYAQCGASAKGSLPHPAKR